jgi:hypothetical protein
MQEKKDKKVIGRAERISLPELGIENVSVRIDTGARTSAFWASNIVLNPDGTLAATLFGPSHALHNGQPLTFTEVDEVMVSTSTGEIQQRYKVRILVKIRGKKIRAWFTLADRSTQAYPVLIGRNVLLGKFVVDVKKGRSDKEAEQRRSDEIDAKLQKKRNDK